MEEVILTPIYTNTYYEYHECSNCKGKIYFEEKLGTPFYFEENIKYCPFCAGKVIRYGKPKYKELPNWDWLEEFRKIIDKTWRYLEYKIHCEIDDKQRKELIKKADFGEKYFGRDFCFFRSNGNICWIIYDIAHSNIHYSTKKKLEKEFGLKE